MMRNEMEPSAPPISPHSDDDGLMVEYAPDVLFVVDRDGLLTRVSPSVSTLTGVPADLLLGQPVVSFARPCDRAAATEAIRGLLRGGVAEFEGRVDETRERPLWLCVRAVPIVGADGTVVGGVGSARDITRQKVAESALSESEERYHLLADHAADVVTRLGLDRVIDWVSPSVTAVLGWSPDELVGRLGDELVHPDDLRAMKANRAALHDRLRPTPPEESQLARILAKDGSYRWMRARQSVIVDDAGRLREVVSGLTDVDEVVHAREAAERAEALLRVTLDTLLDPHVVLRAVRDDDGSIVDFVHLDANQAACDFNACTRDELIGASIVGHRPQDEAYNRQLTTLFAHVVETGVPLVLDDFEFEQREGAAEGLAFDVRAAKVGDGVVNTWRDVTDRHRMEARLSALASHDALTGLANRSAMIDELARALSAGTRAHTDTGVVMLDVDHFKFVNDSLGHGMGDLLLREAARRLERVVRAGDLVARLGGDEFVVVMRDLESPHEAFRVGDRIVSEFRPLFDLGGNYLEATASVGVTVSTPTSDPESMLREADMAMYRAKRTGRNGVRMYNDRLRATSQARAELEQQLRPAMDLGQLVVHYQPEVDLQNGRVCGVEALLRWQHPSGELFAADRFIDLAEEAGLIIDIGRWVADEACTAMVGWMIGHPGALRTLALNLSRAQLADPTLIDDLSDSFTKCGLDPAILTVEVPESTLVRAASIVSANLAQLQRLGVHLALDNFGEGDAALLLLRQYRVDAVKIDRRLVNEVERNSYSRRLVGGIAALAGVVGLRVSAEGVETAKQAAILAELGCNTGHGYYYSGAVARSEFERMIDHRLPLAHG